MGEQVKYFTLDGEYTAELPEASQTPRPGSAEGREMDKRALAILGILVLMMLAFCAGLSLG